MRLLFTAWLLLATIRADETAILGVTVGKRAKESHISLRRDPDERFKIVMTVPQPKGEKWHHWDITLEVFDRNGRPIEVQAGGKPESAFTTVIWHNVETAYAIFMLGKEVPARAKLRFKDDRHEIVFDPANLPKK
jgi:hypothetical protein